ncbi:MAG: DUF4139 domain-containing protein [Methanothrix sp.]|uniref:DUF4139 domain-containing protein n=1 Tax=Methanothrix sp. TaxID=90426 RepID=UPI00198398BF|nr:DUF4139 domain-containing protein [Methanothrix sp.]
MRSWTLLAILLLTVISCANAGDGAKEVVATTTINLPVDSVTIYQDGLVFIKRMGSMDLTEGTHKFVIDIPENADTSSLLFLVTNSSLERIVYDKMPVYTINVTSTARQSFLLSYLVRNGGYWAPNYYMHLLNDSMLLTANALINVDLKEDLKNVQIRLVAMPEREIPIMMRAPAPTAAKAEELSVYDIAAGAPTGELETLFVFVLENRTDLVAGKSIGLPLFEDLAPAWRVYTWDAYYNPDGPANEEIRANNTADHPWPNGNVQVFRDGEYVTTLSMPYTAKGANASLSLGPSADLKLSKKLMDYNITENVVSFGNGTAKVTTENWTYQLEIKSNTDKEIDLEVKDTIPMEAKVIDVSPEPSEMTATLLKWNLSVAPREEMKIRYAYRVVTVETIDGE